MEYDYSYIHFPPPTLPMCPAICTLSTSCLILKLLYFIITRSSQHPYVHGGGAVHWNLGNLPVATRPKRMLLHRPATINFQ